MMQHRQAIANHRWWCPVTTCRKAQSLCHGSFFEKSKLSLQKWFILLHWWIGEYHRGRPSHQQMWVFGTSDMSVSPALGVMELVASCDAATLLPIIQRHVHPGTIVWSDMWAAYNNVQHLPPVAQHQTVFMWRERHGRTASAALRSLCRDGILCDWLSDPGSFFHVFLSLQFPFLTII